MVKSRIGGDAGLIRLVWTFGVVNNRQVAALCGCHHKYVRARLSRLVTAGALRAERRRDAGYVYWIGPRVAQLAPEYAGGWAPPPATVRHALLATDLVVAALGRASPPITRWVGEAELRVWPEPGESIPDALLCWAGGRICVEADRGTEGQRIWQRKLARYRLGPQDVVLVSAPGAERARRIANLAHARGVPLFAGCTAELCGAGDPVVFDATVRTRRPLSLALAALITRADPPVAG